MKGTFLRLKYDPSSQLFRSNYVKKNYLCANPGECIKPPPVELNFEDMKHVDCYMIANCLFRVEGENLPSAVERISAFRTFMAREGVDMFGFVETPVEEAPHPGGMLFELFHDGCRMEFSSCDGGHVLIMYKGEAVLKLWHTEESVIRVAGVFEPQMLKFAMWIGFGLETISRRRIALHCSCIVKDEKAYLFLGESGTGKSTHTRLWRENIAGAFLLNDDSPILSLEEGEVWIYGSPWSGKTPCYRQERYLLGGAVRLSQAPYNKIYRLPLLRAFAALHPSCPPQFAKDPALYDEISATLSEVLGKIAVWHLECLPDADAAMLSCETVTKN